MTDAAARAVDLFKQYGSDDTAVVALDHVSIEFGKNEFTAIMGPSGSGKSTLMHTMAGLDSETSGSAFIGDTDMSALNDKNITLPTDIAGKNVDKQWFEEVTRRLGLAERLEHRPAELSGGQQQRVACARALVSRPEIIFGDEPTGNLDSNSSAEVLDILRTAVDKDNQTVVIVTHDAKAASYADRVVFLADGKLVNELHNPTMEAIHQVMAEIEG